MRRASVGRWISLWLPPLAYMALVFALSAQSNPMPAVTDYVWDKFLHTLEYAALGLLLTRAFLGRGLRWRGAVVVAIVLASAYGATDEYHQSFVPLRTADVHDWLADTLGAAIGSLSYAAFSSRRLLNKLSRPQHRLRPTPPGL